jgi:protein SCO1
MRSAARTVTALALTLLACAGAGAIDPPASWGGVGVVEHLGGTVPLDTPFRDEEGKPIALRELVTVPTVLTMVYYRCPNACDLMLTGLGSVLREMQATPGKDYRVVMLTIDDRETLVDALAAKRIGMESIQGPFPPEAWRFLTGDAASIIAVADAIGFHFARDGNDFDHPLGLVVVSPQGKIIRYLMGTEFLPLDLRLSLLEASTGTVGPTIGKLLRFCFRYDPKGRTYVLDILKVTATVTLTLAGAFVVYLVISGRKRRARAKAEGRATSNG